MRLQGRTHAAGTVANTGCGTSRKAQAAAGLLRRLAASRADLESLEARLTDESIYSDQARKAELTQLIADQAARKAEIQTLEWDWLEASEALEAAE